MTPDPLERDERLPSRPLRVLRPGKSLIEITLRTFHGHGLMKPTESANAAILGVLGRALFLYPEVELVGFWFLSNHYTLLVLTSSQLALSRFENHLNGNLAKELGRQVGWTERFWGRRYRPIPVGESDETQENRFRYLLSQGTKEGLVGRPEDWPGVSSLRAHLFGEKIEGVWFDRTKEYEANRRRPKNSKEPRKVFPTTYEIKLVPLPCWKDLSAADRRRASVKMVRDIERTAKKARSGKPPLGVKKILAQDPHVRPPSVAESPAPLSHGNKSERASYRDFYIVRIRAFRDASLRLRSGDANAWRDFPRGTFPPPIPPGSRVRGLRKRTARRATSSAAGTAAVSSA